MPELSLIWLILVEIHKFLFSILAFIVDFTKDARVNFILNLFFVG